jgi:hypothetical protein
MFFAPAVRPYLPYSITPFLSKVWQRFSEVNIQYALLYAHKDQEVCLSGMVHPSSLAKRPARLINLTQICLTWLKRLWGLTAGTHLLFPMQGHFLNGEVDALDLFKLVMKGHIWLTADPQT